MLRYVLLSLYFLENSQCLRMLHYVLLSTIIRFVLPLCLPGISPYVLLSVYFLQNSRKMCPSCCLCPIAQFDAEILKLVNVNLSELTSWPYLEGHQSDETLCE